MAGPMCRMLNGYGAGVYPPWGGQQPPQLSHIWSWAHYKEQRRAPASTTGQQATHSLRGASKATATRREA